MRRKVNIVLYSKEMNGVSENLQKTMETLVPKTWIEPYHTVEGLSERLSQPTHNALIAVVLPKNREDLRDVASMQHLLYDVRSIVILPDKDEETMALGHGLRPRFVSYRDGDFKDVAAVLSKMVAYHKAVNK
jgi:hypothetical protein